jgi:hypothetical protein
MDAGPLQENLFSHRRLGGRLCVLKPRSPNWENLAFRRGWRVIDILTIQSTVRLDSAIHGSDAER